MLQYKVFKGPKMYLKILDKSKEKSSSSTNALPFNNMNCFIPFSKVFAPTTKLKQFIGSFLNTKKKKKIYFDSNGFQSLIKLEHPDRNAGRHHVVPCLTNLDPI